MLSILSRFTVCFLSLVLFLIGCGGGGSGGGTSEVNDEFLRLILGAVDVESVEVAIGSDPPERINVQFGESTEYFDSPEGEVALSVKEDGQALPTISSTIEIASGAVHTYLMTKVDGVLTGTLLTDDTTTPDETRVRARFINVAVNTGVDVYITDGSSSIRDQDPAIVNVAFNSASDYLVLDEGDYNVLFTRTGSSTAIAQTGGVNFGNKAVRSVVLFESLDGGSPYSAQVLKDKN